MSKFRRRVSVMALLMFLIGVPLMGGQHVLAGANPPPEGAKEFAEQHFGRIVEDVVFSDDPSGWGFLGKKGSITFSELYPIYSLNADFALGRTDDMTTDQPSQWVAVIFQDGRPVNAIGTRQTADGRFEFAAVGYPPELPNGLLNLEENEMIIHEFPADAYYVYAENTGTIRKLEPSDANKTRSSSLSKEQFQRLLMERYKNAFASQQDLAGSHPSNAVLYPVLIIAVLGGAWLYYRRRWKTRN